MTFREYIELPYKAYLLERGVLTKLHNKVKDGTFLQDLENDPEMQNWNQINPRSVDPRKQGRSKYYPNQLNPQEGVRVFESREKKSVKRYWLYTSEEIEMSINVTNKIIEDNLKQSSQKQILLIVSNIYKQGQQQTSSCSNRTRG